jgi:chemotaxis protein MotB
MRRGGHGDGNGERWLLTYADMLTLLFSLFIVMYGVAQTETSGKLRQLEKELKTRFNKQYDIKYVLPILNKNYTFDKLVESLQVSSGKGAEDTVIHDDLLLLSHKLYRALQEQDRSHLVEMHLVRRGLVLSIMTDKLLFDLGSTDLRPQSIRLLDGIARFLMKDDHEIRIEGHTCNLPLKPRSRFRNNWELSTLRAASVAERLIRVNGIEPTRVAVVGYGEFRPFCRNDSEAGRNRNRRVDIVLLRKPGEKERSAPRREVKP